MIFEIDMGENWWYIRQYSFRGRWALLYSVSQICRLFVFEWSEHKSGAEKVMEIDRSELSLLLVISCSF